MLSMVLGRKGVEETFGQKLSDKFWIHRTRQNFPNNGMDDFGAMAKRGLSVLDRVMTEEVKAVREEGAWIYTLE
jgi:hypothetical protein